MSEQEINARGIYVESNFNGLWSVNACGTWLFKGRRWFKTREAALAYAAELAEIADYAAHDI